MAPFNHPGQFEPLLPTQGLDGLVADTRRVVEGSARLHGALHPVSATVLQELVREMNSYYSNLIEGQSTHPQNIARALKADFSARPDIAQRQRIAVAHIEAERTLETIVRAQELAEGDMLRTSFLLDAHDSLYSRLAPEDRTTADGRVIEPGQLRHEDVTVGRHVPPDHASVPAFLQRMDAVYPKVKGVDHLLVTIASAHHRAVWVHPFGDGNGRACRLQTHCALFPMSGGLWSVSRGLARQRETYYAKLANADQPRQGDLDGRGNLSERMLREWCEFFLKICVDQVEFMSAMLRLDDLKERIQALVLVRAAQASRYPGYRQELVLPLQHVAVQGPLSRAEFRQMTGLGSRTAQQSMSQLLGDGVLQSDQPKGPVHIGFPLDALSILFPNLYPEAATTNLET